MSSKCKIQINDKTYNLKGFRANIVSSIVLILLYLGTIMLLGLPIIGIYVLYKIL